MPAEPHQPASAGDVAATFCATLVDEWARAGVRLAVVSPGSRSTPMALALADNDEIRLEVHHDERSAAFHALGAGLATGVPGVVVTTSGTAAAELHPAVVEAHHARVPLIVCTADRPPELQDVGAPQTIDQSDLFGPALRWFTAPGVPTEAGAGRWRPLAARAVIEATGARPGPVQLNLAFDEPLVGTAGALPAGREGRRAWLASPERPEPPPADLLDALAQTVRGRRAVIVAGGGIADPAGVHELAVVTGWPVVADARSGCRSPAVATISHADALLRDESFAQRARPEVVLRLGMPHASKAVGQWLAGLDAWQVGIDPHGQVFDPWGTLSSVIAAEPGRTCRLLAQFLEGTHDTGWLEQWAGADAGAGEAIVRALACHEELTEPGIARDVVAALPQGTDLFVSSSMPVRDVDAFAAPRDGVRVLANRGANGIDGVLSTAVGVALHGRPTAVLIGDVALLHDSNALLGLAARGVDLTIVVVHNDGGGIFSFLPQARDVPADRFEAVFGTPHGVDLAALAAAHGLALQELQRAHDVRDAVAGSVAAGGVRLLVARTDRRANVAVHEELQAAVSAALERSG